MQIAQAAHGGAALSGGQFQGSGGGGLAQEVGLDSARVFSRGTVDMNRDKNVGIVLIRERGAIFKRDESVSCARQENLVSWVQSLPERRRNTAGNIQNQIFPAVLLFRRG